MTLVPMISILGILSFLPHLLAFDLYTKYSQLNLADSFGPDSVALDPFNQGPYVGVQDGRILKYIPNVGFVDFAYTAPGRPKQLCDGTTNIDLGKTCGRPFGFSFNPVNGELFIVDAYLGLFKVGLQGGEAALLANSAGGVAFNFLNGIDYDPLTKLVYFTDASLNYNLKDAMQGKNFSGDSSGRLMAYDTRTGEVKILLEGFPIASRTCS